ncbi:MAG: nitrate reductase molybdenum cofactor assembly chaperone [Planctomycetes bacterium]|nr:nitrate reductase molybdenum cofactor assembly chaperone [Planctomycetota bacterium]
MNAASILYDGLAGLLAYPDDQYVARLKRCHRSLCEKAPDAGEFVTRFAQRVGTMTTEELQEAYTRIFDLDPVCSLEVGWHLFGENYSRGEFLAEMRGQLRRLEVPESTELPDHMTHVLRALGRMAPKEADRFATKFVLPALDKMQQGLQGRECPWEDVLEAIRALILSPQGASLEEVYREEVHHG